MTSQLVPAMTTNRQFGGVAFINDRNLILSSLYELSFQQEQAIELEQLDMDLNDPERSRFEIRIYFNDKPLINALSIKDDKIILGVPELIIETCTFTNYATLKQCFQYLIEVIIKKAQSKPHNDMIIEQSTNEEQKSSDIVILGQEKNNSIIENIPINIEQESLSEINTISDTVILKKRLKSIENCAILNDSEISKLRLYEQEIISQLRKVVTELETKLIIHKNTISEAESIRTQLEKLYINPILLDRKN